MRTSYSALQMFRTCPKRYEFKIIEHIREAKTREQVFGTLVHEALQFMFQHEPLYPTLDQVIDFYREKFPRDWPPAEAELYRAHGETMLRNFYGKNAPWNFVVLDLESRFEVILEDAETRTTHILAGIMDRIDKLPDGSFEIIDYKTQKKMPSQEKVDRDLQLSIYAMGLKKRWPHIEAEKIKLSLVFLKHGEKLSTARSDRDFAHTEEETLRTIREIETRAREGSSFEPIVSPLCDFCGYKPICPAWRHLYKNVKTEEIEGARVPEILNEFFGLKDDKARIEQRLKELSGMLTRYLEAEEIDRVFGEGGMVAKRIFRKYAYDFERIRGILEPLGRWQDVLKADEARLKAIMKEIPEAAREEIAKARMLLRSTVSLAATRKKTPPPPGTKSPAELEDQNPGQLAAGR